MQEFQILKCIECRTYQVDIVKKAKKWTCKMCNQKQSVRKVYFTSYAAKECREKAQSLNLNSNLSKNVELETILDKLEEDDLDNDELNLESVSKDDFSFDESENRQNLRLTPAKSKWSKFTSTIEDQEKASKSWSICQEATPQAKPLSSKFMMNTAISDNSSFHEQSSSSFYSIYHQPKRRSPPKLIDLHKKPQSKTSEKPAIFTEPPHKRLKQVEQTFDDDFVLSQDDLNYLDDLK